MQFYNMMSCSGFDAGFMCGCSMAWIGLVIAVFVIMVTRKWVFEEALQQDFGFILGLTGTILSYFISIGLIGSYKWATLIGMICGLAAGYFAPMFMSGGSSNEQF